MPAYALTIFLGAFLLFQVQPLIGKYILPWFGGGPGVWTTCMLFFQVMLLGGYAYAHFLSQKLKVRTQVIVHLILLALAVALLPITPSDSWKPDGSGNPTWQILKLLLVCLGLPYFVLSSTGPLMQQWFSRTNPGVSPYRLYALSNVGSLLALLSYPFYFETHFTRVAQARLWAGGLVAFVVACGWCAGKLWQARVAVRSDESSSRRREEADGAGGVIDEVRLLTSAATPTIMVKLLWLLLPACASVLLLATTNKLCQDVAVIPFLWILPLALYLLSFIICFDSPRWYVRWLFGPALVLGVAAICWIMFEGVDASLRKQVTAYCGGLFVCCMVCHGELYRLRPDPSRLTGFYLMIAAGGAGGGIFVAAIAPQIFADYFELNLGLAASVWLFLFVCLREASQWFGNLRQHPPRFWRTKLVTYSWLALGAVALSYALGKQTQHDTANVISRSRNFYGTLKVYEYSQDSPQDHYFLLQHGRITHGLQFTDPHFANVPTTYYAGGAGVKLAVAALPEGPRHIGVVGLGTGSMAVFGRAGDQVRIYEINEQVKQIATAPFTYLSNSPAKVEVVLGDARLSMEREPAQHFDLLALDAFSSDAIPVHLLTKEAFALYDRHMKTNGIIAVHVSNRYLNLEPVIANLAREFNYFQAVISFDEEETNEFGEENDWWVYGSTWVLLTRDESVIKSPAIADVMEPAKTKLVNIPLWTDDFASMFQIMIIK